MGRCPEACGREDTDGEEEWVERGVDAENCGEVREYEVVDDHDQHSNYASKI